MGKWDKHKRVLLGARDDRPTLYMPIEISEFADWAVLQPCAKRVEQIVRCLDKMGREEPGTLLDVGCHTGYMSRAMTRHGWSVVGVEPSKEWFDIAVSLGQEMRFGGMGDSDGNGPAHINVAVSDDRFLSMTDGHFDVALVLSVVMYFFRNRDEADGWAELNRVADIAPTMFLDFGGQYAKHLPFDRADAIDKIVKNTPYTNGQFLCKTDFEDRPLYVFWRDE